MTWERGVFLAGVGIFIHTTLFATIDFVEFIIMLAH